jgi:hypothetical protein
MNFIFTQAVAAITIPIRPCPFCGSKAEFVSGEDQFCRGIQCPACSACLPPVNGDEFQALARWNRRSGSAAAAGGRATRGISTAKKRQASRRNLELARQAKAVMKINSEVSDSIAILKEARRAEIEDVEAIAAERRARLKHREGQIMADPHLRQLYGLLKPVPRAHLEGDGASKRPVR